MVNAWKTISYYEKLIVCIIKREYKSILWKEKCKEMKTGNILYRNKKCLHRYQSKSAFN